MIFGHMSPTIVRRACAVIAGAATLCTGSAVAQESPTCRVYAAEEVRTLSGAGSGTIEQDCHFDTATVSRVCTMRSRTNAGSFTLVFTDKYKSVADFVDEIVTIPPIARIHTQERRFTSGSGPGAVLTYEYDDTRRQTRVSTAMTGNVLVTTYNAWDPKGRPTSATVSSRASTFALRYAYDDSARTMTITGPAGVEVDTFDADGNMIHETSTDGGGTTTFRINITKTDKVCK